MTVSDVLSAGSTEEDQVTRTRLSVRHSQTLSCSFEGSRIQICRSIAGARGVPVSISVCFGLQAMSLCTASVFICDCKYSILLTVQ